VNWKRLGEEVEEGGEGQAEAGERVSRVVRFAVAGMLLSLTACNGSSSADFDCWNIYLPQVVFRFHLDHANGRWSMSAKGRGTLAGRAEFLGDEVRLHNDTGEMALPAVSIINRRSLTLGKAGETPFGPCKRVD
jgi:hypothetical protein